MAKKKKNPLKWIKKTTELFKPHWKHNQSMVWFSGLSELLYVRILGPEFTKCSVNMSSCLSMNEYKFVSSFILAANYSIVSMDVPM